MGYHRGYQQLERKNRSARRRKGCDTRAMRTDHAVPQTGLMALTRPTTATPGADDARWQAVVARDRAADGTFVYSVQTTGVYCRPSCASRLARRTNVQFHATPADARRAGFRACRRCRPDRPGAEHAHAAMIADACRAIEHADEMPTLTALAARAGLSPHHFHRVFKQATGVTPREYAAARRADRVRRGLASPGGTVTDAIYDAGFNSSGRFYESAGETLGMTPSAFKAGGAKAEIRFAVGQCSLGAILVAQSAKGVCAILLGDDPAALVRQLEDLFPRATLVGGDPDFERTVATVVGFVEQPSLGLDLPLDIRGTAFQQRVWRALRRVPAGRVVSYAELAERLGMPHGARAVARACATNRLAVAIPCHRVVRTGGGLSGYRWGIARKQTLIDRERDGARPA
jgi:AraC family transcriptional regulator of adaptative response/methylated-DNA-[protein]-cysteine methyltransferase